MTDRYKHSRTFTLDVDLLEYVRVMARVQGKTLSGVVNDALRDHLEQHKDIYEQALAFRQMMNLPGDDN